MRWVLGILGIGVIVVVVIMTRQPAEPAAVNTSNQTTVVSRTGVSLSPKSFEGEDFANFFPLASELGQILTWAGDVGELSKPEGAPTVVTTLAEQSNLEPVMIIGVSAETLKNTGSRDQAKLQIIGWSDQHQPEMIGIGNEINYTFRDDPDGLTSFVSFFEEVVPEIKKVSPETEVFTVWQLEWLKGLHGGLYGGQNNTEALSQWFLLEQFPSADFFAYTTYPMLIYQTPEEIPPTYYSEIADTISKPMAFSEAGWFRTGPKGWASSVTEQTDFIERFFALTDELDSRFRIWPFVYDQAVTEPFTTLGLLKTDQTTSPAFEAWRDAP